MKVINYDNRIRGLEKRNDFDFARDLRKEALQTIPFSHQAPLLRSEGEDLLYRRNACDEALAVFEQAISAMQQAPSMYGMSYPDRIYGGAAQAAIHCNQKEKANKYYQEFSSIVKDLSKDPKLESCLKWHQETLDYLEKYLQFNK